MLLEDIKFEEEQQPPDPFYESLVLNAMDFLRKSVDELERSPKYSVIHFCTAIELFLKARLLAEHWTLIISDINKVRRSPGESIRSKFEAGDFHSVGLDKAVKRLQGVCGIKIPGRAVHHFNEVRKHRNKLVHFYHPAYPAKPGHKEVVPEQWSAWYYLHRLLMTDWRDHFSKYEEEIEDLHNLVHGNWKYMDAKYGEVRPEIEEEKKRGVTYYECSLCGYESARFEDSDILLSRDCVVCHYRENVLRIECPDCNGHILVEDLGEGQCENCGSEIDIDYLLSVLGPYEDPREEPEIAYCAECSYSQRSTIPFGDYHHLCLNCLTLHDMVGNCDFCGKLIAGANLEASCSFGCILCDGAVALEND